ncbi:MAG: PAS domain-containing protein [Spirochaetaceae bacterium]|jgi:PAS domain-containing protein|nr:PAS domain-containing protein [Spirochaetaceae bacterium]
MAKRPVPGIIFFPRFPLIGVFLAFFIAAPVFFPSLEAAERFHINLRNCPVYYRLGFDLAEIRHIPGTASTGRWWRLDRFPARGPLRVRDLVIPGLAGRPFLSARMLRDMEFTFLVPFTLDAEGDRAIQAGATPGLFISALGDNWEIYLNGSLIRSELYLAPDGSIGVHRALEEIALPLFHEAIPAGQNILAIRIVGDPSGQRTGLFRAGPVYAGDYDSIRARQTAGALVRTWLAALFFFTAVCFLWLYCLRRKESYHGHFAVFILVFLVHLLSGTEMVRALITDTALLLRIEYASLFLIAPFFGFFAESRLRYGDGSGSAEGKGFFLYMKIYFLVCLAAAALLFVFPFGFEADILLLWKCTIGPAVLLFFVHDVILAYAAASAERYQAALREKSRAAKRDLYLEAFRDSAEGRLLAITAALIAAAIVDSVNVLFFRADPVITRFALAAYIFASMLTLIRRIELLHAALDGRDRECAGAEETIAALKRALEDGGAQLEQKIHDLTQAHMRITVNTQHYQSLFNESRDPLAVLDGNLRFVQANSAAIKLFSLEYVDIENRTTLIPALPDRLFLGAADREMRLEQFWNSVYAFRLNKTPMELDVFTASGERRRHFTVRLEYRISPDTGFEIFARFRLHDEAPPRPA